MREYRRVIFFHVPKCAGTTIEVALAGMFGKEQVKFPATVEDYLVIPPSFLHKHRVLAGHITHDTALPYIDDSTYLMTLLRDPADRLRSLYNYFCGLNDGSLIHRLSSEMTFWEWITSEVPQILIQKQNAVIRQFTPESYWDTNRAANPELIVHYACGFLSKFHLVGFVARMNQFVAEFDREMGAALIVEGKENVSKKDNTQVVTRDALLDWMQEYSRLDLEFYDFACRRFGG